MTPQMKMNQKMDMAPKMSIGYLLYKVFVNKVTISKNLS